MKLEEIKQLHRDCKIVIREHEINVFYSSGTNKMALPHRVARYIPSFGEWEKEE